MELDGDVRALKYIQKFLSVRTLLSLRSPIIVRPFSDMFQPNFSPPLGSNL